MTFSTFFVPAIVAALFFAGRAAASPASSCDIANYVPGTAESFNLAIDDGTNTTRYVYWTSGATYVRAVADHSAASPFLYTGISNIENSGMVEFFNTPSTVVYFDQTTEGTGPIYMDNPQATLGFIISSFGTDCVGTFITQFQRLPMSMSICAGNVLNGNLVFNNGVDQVQTPGCTPVTLRVVKPATSATSTTSATLRPSSTAPLLVQSSVVYQQVSSRVAIATTVHYTAESTTIAVAVTRYTYSYYSTPLGPARPTSSSTVTKASAASATVAISAAIAVATTPAVGATLSVAGVAWE